MPEVLLAKEVHLVLGNTGLSPTDFHRAIHANTLAPNLATLAIKTNPTSIPGLHAFTSTLFFADSLEPPATLASILTALHALPLQATNPRDHIYAFLALHPTGPLLIPPHYPSPTPAIYTATTAALIAETTSLAVLGLCDNDPSSPSLLPSWVPDWSRAAPPTVPLFSPAAHHRRRNNTTSACASAATLTSPKTLLVTGTPIDRISALASQPFPLPSSEPQSCCGERRDSHTPDPLELGRVAAEVGVRDDVARVVGVLAAGEEEEEEDGGPPIARSLKYAAGRRVGCGEGGRRLGLVPAGARVGDEVWVLRGCPGAVVLRGSEEGGWRRLVGACFWEGEREEVGEVRGWKRVELV